MPVAAYPAYQNCGGRSTRLIKTQELNVNLNNSTHAAASVNRDPRKLVNSAQVFIPRIAVLVISAYIAAQMLSDIASLKIGVVLGFAVDMGTFIYPITFTLRDMAHKVIGKRNAQMLVVTAGVINLSIAALLAELQVAS